MIRRLEKEDGRLFHGGSEGENNQSMLIASLRDYIYLK